MVESYISLLFPLIFPDFDARLLLLPPPRFFRNRGVVLSRGEIRKGDLLAISDIGRNETSLLLREAVSDIKPNSIAHTNDQTLFPAHWSNVSFVAAFISSEICNNTRSSKPVVSHRKAKEEEAWWKRDGREEKDRNRV